jgi:hypothetical protein
MALNTPAQVVADWIELRDDILPLVEEEGLPGGALDAAVALAVIQGSGVGGASASDIGNAVNRPKSTFTGTVSTAATGTNFVQLVSAPASEVVIYNRSGVEISWRYGASGQELRIVNGIGETIPVVANADEIRVRRTDQSNTPVTINYRGVLM